MSQTEKLSEADFIRRIADMLKGEDHVRLMKIADRLSSEPARKSRGKSGGAMSGEEFAALYQTAVRRAGQLYGDEWYKNPEVKRRASVTGAARSYKTERGTVLTFPTVFTVPEARFWPGDGGYPPCLTVHPPIRYSRQEGVVFGCDGWPYDGMNEWLANQPKGRNRHQQS